MAGDSAGRISITVSCLSGARTEKRETGDEGEECEEFFHIGVVGGWVLTALHAAITSDWPLPDLFTVATD